LWAGPEAAGISWRVTWESGLGFGLTAGGWEDTRGDDSVQTLNFIRLNGKIKKDLNLLSNLFEHRYCCERGK